MVVRRVMAVMVMVQRDHDPKAIDKKITPPIWENQFPHAHDAFIQSFAPLTSQTQFADLELRQHGSKCYHAIDRNLVVWFGDEDGMARMCVIQNRRWSVSFEA